MAKTTKATRAAEAAVVAAAAAATDAKNLSRTLPKKEAKKLKSLADEAKDAARVSKKKIVRKPGKVEKAAIASINRLDKAVDKAEAGLAARRKAAAKEQLRAAKKAAAKKAKAPSVKAPPESGTSERAAAEGEVVADPAAQPSLYEAPAPELPTSTGAPVATRPRAAEDLSSLTVTQLRARARAAGHAGFSRYTKAQLMALLSS